MSNLRPASSMAVADGPILKRDSESGVRLMQTAIFTVGPRSVEMLAEVSLCLPVVKAKYDGHPEEGGAKGPPSNAVILRKAARSVRRPKDRYPSKAFTCLGAR